MSLAPLPDVEQLASFVGVAQPKHRAIVRLHAVLEQMGRSEGQEPRVARLVELMKWLRATGRLPENTQSSPADKPTAARMRLLVEILCRVEGARERLAANLRGVLENCNLMDLLARLGIPEDRGFMAEMVDRFWTAVLPSGLTERDAIWVLLRLFPNRQAMEDFASVPSELWLQLLSCLGGAEESPAPPLRRAMIDALRLVALRLAASGLFDALRERSPATRLIDSPFFRLQQATIRFIDGLESEVSLEPGRAAHCHELVEDCRSVTNSIVENLERTGVSIDLVYRLEAISKGLRRYADLIFCLEPSAEPKRSFQLLESLVDEALRRGEFSEMVRSSTHLLARKIIERAGETGEHYITRTRKEYVHLLGSAAGGGVLTCATTVVKYQIVWIHLAPFIEGLLAAMNYAGSFLLMQLLGFTLATKQPSMTAAAVAASMRARASNQDLSGLVTMIAQVTRSQLAAALGNLGLVIPTAALFDLYWRSTHAKSFLDPDTANYVLHSLSPFGTATVLYAAFTGVLLWTSSIGAGWFENWVVYRRIPHAIENHRLGRYLGRTTTGWLSRALHRNVSGIGGNVTLGTLLGLIPVLGKFIGVPLDVRHVTLSTGALTLAVCTLGTEALTSHEFRDAAVGIVVIGLLNFGVSFVLALLVALRAKEVGLRDRFRLLLSVVATALRSPLGFIFPPAGAEHAVHGPVSRRPPREL